MSLLSFSLLAPRPKKYIGVVEPLCDALLRLSAESGKALLSAGVLPLLASAIATKPFSQEAATRTWGNFVRR